MSKENSAVSEEEKPQNNTMTAFSPFMKELEEALDILYIKNNASGRNKFRDKWPLVAEHLFGETLINYDNHGPKDRKRRAKLEEEADERRLLLKVTISEIVEKSVEAGMLNFEYVGKVIDTFGGELSKFLYAENIIERVRPGLLNRNKPENSAKESSLLHGQEKENLQNHTKIEDEMDRIKPIETDSQKPITEPNRQSEPSKHRSEEPKTLKKHTEQISSTINKNIKSESEANKPDIPESLPNAEESPNMESENKEHIRTQTITKGHFVAIFNKVA